MIKTLPTKQETRVLSLCWEDALANPLQHSCLGNPMDRGAWWIYSPWCHKRVGHDLAAIKLNAFQTFRKSPDSLLLPHLRGLTIDLNCVLLFLRSCLDVRVPSPTVFLKKRYFFIWLHQVLAVASRVFFLSCSTWDL